MVTQLSKLEFPNRETETREIETTRYAGVRRLFVSKYIQDQEKRISCMINSV